MEPEFSLRDVQASDGYAGAMLTPTEALEGGIIAPPSQSADSDADAASVERLAMRVGNLHLLCVPDAGREVLTPPPVSRLPHTPEWLPGVANVRGALVPVVDLALAFGLERLDTRRAYLLISGTGDSTIGLLVDGLPVLQRFEAADRLNGVPPHPSMLDGHVYGAYASKGVVWMDMDLQGLLNTLADMIVQLSE